MRKGFTFIEVVIAVVILALVGTALLKNGSDGIEFLQKVNKKDQAIYTISIVANHRNPSFNYLQKPLEAFLDSYLIDDLEVQKVIKEQKFKYLETYPKVNMPILERFEDEEESKENTIPLQVVKLSIYNKDLGDYLFILELNE